jgi:ribose-phosphate pyrophosphokinase
MILVNDVMVEEHVFNGGEVHLTLPIDITTTAASTIVVVAHLRDSEDIMRLLLTVDAVKRAAPSARINLFIPYFPYARQDRVCNEGEAFGAKVMADLINSLNCDNVLICDPHSDVTPALINNCIPVSQHDIVAEADIVKDGAVLCSPDAGAEKKILNLSQELGGRDIIYGAKIRDTKTGEITETRISGDCQGKDVLIVDDICDGGRTFIELAKVLKKAGAKSIELYVTHGIFSQGTDVLLEEIDKIYCNYPFIKGFEIDGEVLCLV